MLGLTLIRPWEAAILYLGKPIENRKWRPSDKVRGQRIALHAGMGWEKTSLPYINENAVGDLGRLNESRDRHSLIVGTVRVDGWWRVEERPPRQWAFGPWCWEFADPFPLPEPVPCKGALGLWRLPADVEACVLEQERAR
jgi:hypothetical protein